PLLLVVALGLGGCGSPLAFTPASPVVELPTPTPAPSSDPDPAPSAGEEAVTSWPPVPILMYHQIGDPPPDHPWPDLYVSRETFAAQLDWLEEKGFHPLTLKEVLSAWHEGRALPPNPVVITFDDGYASTVEVALPLLQQHSFQATLFLQGNILGRPGAVTETMVQTWLQAGMELGSHTMRHLDLTRVSEKDREGEVGGSRSFLEKTFAVPVLTFAYPAGRSNEKARAMVEEAGYEAAVTTRPGCAQATDDLFLLPRLRISGGDTLEAFARKVACPP
ncbi:MAG: polysaccharide deacetylase family protein, partial [Bacillota bacterium]|nr:polysaccharide deacetylase family protein [Bacillota bacterium]